MMTPIDEKKDEDSHVGWSVSDGRSRPRPARLVLTMEALMVHQTPIAVLVMITLSHGKAVDSNCNVEKPTEQTNGGWQSAWCGRRGRVGRRVAQRLVGPRDYNDVPLTNTTQREINFVKQKTSLLELRTHKMHSFASRVPPLNTQAARALESVQRQPAAWSSA
ncbi:hypothetical protein EVAR_91807_1 [Eumeta japonica]|uniref:Uncharacterized protein n=1 Tax=Eumeta variegata TaxID=151549 RepID=A0A4C1T6L5_EUMVA|nr:hypothetical protein EVAR_91807_1 [Eumeta japonica]